MAHEKKSQLLGMNFGTARARLERDLVFKFAVQLGHKCHRCGKELTREDFSVDHKDVWSIAENPVEAFFDLDNIAFSHLHCNTAHKGYKSPEHGRTGYNKGCRCDICVSARRDTYYYDKDERRAKYLKYGK